MCMYDQEQPEFETSGLIPIGYGAQRPQTDYRLVLFGVTAWRVESRWPSIMPDALTVCLINNWWRTNSVRTPIRTVLRRLSFQYIRRKCIEPKVAKRVLSSLWQV